MIIMLALKSEYFIYLSCYMCFAFMNNIAMCLCCMFMKLCCIIVQSAKLLTYISLSPPNSLYTGLHCLLFILYSKLCLGLIVITCFE